MKTTTELDFYDHLTLDEVSAVYRVMHFLRRLRIIGNLRAHTARESSDNPLEASYFYVADHSYRIVKDAYDPSREEIDNLEKLEHMFGKSRLVRYRGTY